MGKRTKKTKNGGPAVVHRRTATAAGTRKRTSMTKIKMRTNENPVKTRMMKRIGKRIIRKISTVKTRMRKRVKPEKIPRSRLNGKSLVEMKTKKRQEADAKKKKEEDA